MIYVNFKPPKLISEFIKTLYSIHVDSYGPRRAKAINTYSDPECTVLQCKNGTFRSFAELLEIVRTYYPNCSEKKLLRILFKVNINYKTTQTKLFFRMWYCSIMGKIRITFTEQLKPFEEYAFNYYAKQETIDNYKWEDLLKLLDINSPEELLKFRIENNW